MRQALALAGDAAASGEVPVGCIITDADGNVIGTGRNRTVELSDPTSHAEMEAIRMAAAALGDWRLEGCTLYATLEPCAMCAGTIINSRISNVVFGARDGEAGACGSVIDLFSERFSHKPAVYGGVCADECAAVLKNFFKELRK